MADRTPEELTDDVAELSNEVVRLRTLRDRAQEQAAHHAQAERTAIDRIEVLEDALEKARTVPGDGQVEAIAEEALQLSLEKAATRPSGPPSGPPVEIGTPVPGAPSYQGPIVLWPDGYLIGSRAAQQMVDVAGDQARERGKEAAVAAGLVDKDAVAVGKYAESAVRGFLMEATGLVRFDPQAEVEPGSAADLEPAAPAAGMEPDPRPAGPVEAGSSAPGPAQGGPPIPEELKEHMPDIARDVETARRAAAEAERTEPDAPGPDAPGQASIEGRPGS